MDFEENDAQQIVKRSSVKQTRSDGKITLRIKNEQKLAMQVTTGAYQRCEERMRKEMKLAQQESLLPRTQLVIDTSINDNDRRDSFDDFFLEEPSLSHQKQGKNSISWPQLCNLAILDPPSHPSSPRRVPTQKNYTAYHKRLFHSEEEDEDINTPGSRSQLNYNRQQDNRSQHSSSRNQRARKQKNNISKAPIPKRASIASASPGTPSKNRSNRRKDEEDENLRM
ncbi:unnamed protein product [Didymodactylos carnosus]|uniref:Uncharacterized protein n=1 Tax=Didymodactylos carnosus TaxID=1234261 RepID=A0A8S2CQJ7_9BILA|nr:unnamed protein product [Didymodactylos carnosus]CAF3515037.1 unnamed protein product [Didymodactylos carnosus]